MTLEVGSRCTILLILNVTLLKCVLYKYWCVSQAALYSSVLSRQVLLGLTAYRNPPKHDLSGFVEDVLHAGLKTYSRSNEVLNWGITSRSLHYRHICMFSGIRFAMLLPDTAQKIKALADKIGILCFLLKVC